MSNSGFWWSDEAVTMLRERYHIDGPKKLAEALGTSRVSVSVKACRLGLVTDHRAPAHEWTEAQLSKLHELYATADAATLVQEIGAPWYVIRAKARKIGLRNTTSKERSARTKAVNNTSCDYRYFDQWSPKMAYILGFLFADGSITKRLCDVVVGLSDSDEAVISFITNELKSTAKLYRPRSFSDGSKNRKNQVYLYLRSKLLVQRLMELGMMPRKTYRNDPFPVMSDDMTSHFIRGYLDGDGTINTSPNGTCRVGFIGTHALVSGIRNKLVRLAGMEHRPVVVDKDATTCSRVLWWKERDLQLFQAFVYPPGCGFCLERKKRKLDQWLAARRPNNRGE